MNSTIRCAGSVGLAILFAGAVAAKTPEIKSGWPHAPVKVDGTADQWAGLLAPLPGEPILLGVQNDSNDLYVCLKTSDPKVKAAIAHLGLTVWVSGTGKEDRAYGVRFPIGAGFHHGRGEQPTAESSPPQDFNPSVDGTKIELIGPTDKDRFTVPRADADPIQAAVGDDSGVMVIELRFPLSPSENHPLAVEAKPGAAIAVGLETERPHVERRTPTSGSDRQGGEDQGGEGQGGWGGGHGGWGGGAGSGGMGGYGRGGGHHGGMGRGMGEGGGSMPNLIKVWTRVTLATTPPAPPAATPPPPRG